MLGQIEIKMVALPKKADPAFGSENPADYTQFEELWDIMEDAVENITYDVVPTDWRTIPELGDDPDDEEAADPTSEVTVKVIEADSDADLNLSSYCFSSSTTRGRLLELML